MNINKGYTLLEVLIALAVFAILAVITSNALYQAFTNRARVTEQANRLNQLQLALVVIERDINQILVRTVRSVDQRIFSPFVGQANYTEYSHGGFVNPNSTARRSTITRAALDCNGNQLIRRTWDALDTPNRKKYNKHVLLDKVNCSFSYLNHALEVLSEWHDSGGGDSGGMSEPLPSAIKIKLQLADWGEMSLLYIIPEGFYA